MKTNLELSLSWYLDWKRWFGFILKKYTRQKLYSKTIRIPQIWYKLEWHNFVSNFLIPIQQNFVQSAYLAMSMNRYFALNFSEGTN